MDRNNNEELIDNDSNLDRTIVAVLDNKSSHKTDIQLHKYTDTDIQGMVYLIRGQRVMLDFDLAKIYGYELKKMNQQVKRNMDRFPKDFMFQLTEEEIPESLKSHFVTLNKSKNKRGLHIKKMPYVFTEHGVNQLSAVLKSAIAVKQSILIIRAFVKMRHYIIENRQLLDGYDILKMESRLQDTEQEIHQIENTMATKDDISNSDKKLENLIENFIVTEKIKEFAFFKGDKFEANELFIQLYREAKHSIYIVDNYISIKTLSHLKHKKENVHVIIFTTNAGGRDKLRKVEFNDFNEQYPSLLLKNNSLSHDRYIILDYNTCKEKIYHSGASIKDAGKKVCSINEITDKQIYHRMIDALLLENTINL